MPTPLPTLSGNRLQLWPIIREAMAFPWQYRHALWKWVVVCGVLVGLTDFAAETFGTHDIVKENGPLEHIYDLVFSMLQLALILFLYTVFCIRCHRLVLLGATPETDVFPPQIGEREGSFCRFLVIIYGSIFSIFFCGAVFVPIFLLFWGISDTGYEEWPLFSLSMIPFSYILGRYCMVFPATAVDLQPSFKWAWEQSKGIGWRLGVLAGILPWSLSFIYKGGSVYFGLDQYQFTYSLITGLLWFAVTTIEVAVLSIAFRELSRADICAWTGVRRSTS